MNAVGFCCLVLLVCLTVEADQIRYNHPVLPCAWTFTREILVVDTGEVFHLKTAVSGHHILETMEDSNGVLSYRYVFRDDMGTTFPNVTGFYYSRDENSDSRKRESETRWEVVNFEDVSMLIELTANIERTFENCTYDHVDDDEWYGIPAKHYYLEPQKRGKREDGCVERFYAKDGFPIGGYYGGHEFNASYKPVANLNDFVFPRDIVFAEERIYTPPTTTNCSSPSPQPQPQPTPESKPSAASMVVPAFALLVVAAALIL